MYSSLRGVQDLLGDFWIFVQIWSFWIVLDIFGWITSFKVFLNDNLWVFKSSKNLKNAHFWLFLVEIIMFWEEYGVQSHGRYWIFFHLPNVKKLWKFYSFPFGETFLSPPLYMNRPLCTAHWSRLKPFRSENQKS